jgi:polyhydroxyalkanoate synthesis regulator phasin
MAMLESSLVESAEEAALTPAERKDRALQILKEMVKKHNLSSEEVYELLDNVHRGAEIVAEAKMPFPFTKKETLTTLRADMTESWLHPLGNLAHRLMEHHNIVEKPFLIGGVDKENESGTPNGVVCMCYYSTVRITPDEIKVYSNWDAGGMCPEIVENLVAIHPTPDYIRDLYPQLEAIVDEQAKEGCKTYDVPKKVRLRLPEREMSGPGL